MVCLHSQVLMSDCSLQVQIMVHGRILPFSSNVFRPEVLLSFSCSLFFTVFEGFGFGYMCPFQRCPLLKHARAPEVSAPVAVGN